MSDAAHVDVIVVGAGLSGIGAACHLQMKCPDRSFTILESRSDIGGTWDLFRYPGVRSDSDMHTLGYSFKPWTHEKSIADGPSIMEYLRDTVAEHDLARRIRFDHRVERAEWSSDEARWTVTARHDDGTTTTLTCGFLFVCAGYYSYRGGHRPDFPGIETFEGTVVHPQEWPDDLDHAGERVVVIGSGATAVTLVPAMAESAAHVTMLQRSPTYVVARPDRDAIANVLRRILPDRLAYRATRAKNITFGRFFYSQTRKHPAKVRRRLLDMATAELGEATVKQHFTPRYDPWDQRLCLVPNGDLFEAIRSGRASVVTDHVDHITPTGIRLASGEHLEADIIVTATGLQLVTLGEADIVVDGEPIDFASTFTYRGVAYADVPNLASTFGYINASWTLRADLVSSWVCRVLNHLRETGTEVVVPHLRPEDENMVPRPWIDDFSAGYITRMLPMLPKQGDREPWTAHQDYRVERSTLGS
ncbi:MAG: flavin-containing monooxygenase, partial [Ilumatobacteraceae bacterium]